MHFVSSEALLEMYFLQGTLKELGSMYGVGSLRLIKPSPHDEKWIGIDQAWVSTKLTDDDLIKHLKGTVSSGKPAPFYFAVFRQYKRVEEIKRASKYTPKRDTPYEWSKPYFRCDIYTEPGQEHEAMKINKSKKASGVQPTYSQHEALIRLSALPNADVHYACPMVFTPIDVWKAPDMNQVRLVPVSPNQPTYAGDAKRHHLCFRTQSDPCPEFHSDEGVEARSISFTAWRDTLFESNTKRLTPKHLLATLFAADLLLSPKSKVSDIETIFDRANAQGEEVWERGKMKGHLARDLTGMLSIIEVSLHS
jgi:hypothetical protein